MDDLLIAGVDVVDVVGVELLFNLVVVGFLTVVVFFLEMSASSSSSS